MVAELDWACRAAAVHGAIEAGIGRHTKLFVNVEPSALGARCPQRYQALFALAKSALSIVVEVTERSIVDDPAGLISMLADTRALDMGVAIDDVGAVRESLALLPFVAPDVIKLDMRLVQQCAADDVAAIAAAVRADAERRGAWILVEGIETDAHVEQALVLGARLGQGWLFGRPATLPSMLPYRQRHSDNVVRLGSPLVVPDTPWSLVADWPSRRTATKGLLMPMSEHIEQHSLAGQQGVVLSAFQHAAHFTDATRVRYESLAAHHVMVGVVGTGMGKAPGLGIRSGALPEGHCLTGEWTVTVVGPHAAAALIARECRTTSSCGRERMFEYVVTHDRDTVIAAARSLMQYIEPR